MARTSKRLSDLKVKAAKPGMHPDGDGLYLQVTVGRDAKPRKSWLYRFVLNGRERQMGLGSLSDTGLADARQLAADARKLVKAGKDPINARDDQRAADRLAAELEKAKGITFDQCRNAYFAAHQSGWRSVKYAAGWKRTLEQYASPVFGSLPVDAIDTAAVAKVLDPIWTDKRVTAALVRARIEAVLDWATSRNYRTGENPARWKGHLKNLYPAVKKGRRVEHYAAMPYIELGAFLAALRGHQSMAARGLEFLILTAARRGEVLGARWDEIDLGAKVWSIPADRMKGNRPHRVPLSAPAIVVLNEAAKLRENEWIFPGDKSQRVSKNLFADVIARLGRDNVTVHGFRSTFRDWAAECTNFPREIAEVALAHLLGDETERAYQRGDLFEKRRKLMEAWAKYCGSSGVKTDNVVQLQAAGL
jgi:integrase